MNTNETVVRVRPLIEAALLGYGKELAHAGRGVYLVYAPAAHTSRFLALLDDAGLNAEAIPQPAPLSYPSLRGLPPIVKVRS